MNLLSQFIFKIFLVVRRVIYLSLSFFDIVFPNNKPTVIILSYHSVCRDTWRFSIDPEIIKQQVEYLLDHYTIISLKDLLQFLTEKKKIRFPAVIITFDDGYKDILILKKFFQEKHITPSLFILSDTAHANWKELGTKRSFLTLDEIHSLAKLGWEIGAHSATHANLLTIEKEALKKEIIQSKKELEERLQVPINYFAYPRGKYSSTILQFVKKAHYLLAFTMDDGIISTNTKKYLIPRIGIDRTHTFAEFKATVSPSVITARRLIKHTFIGNYL